MASEYNCSLIASVQFLCSLAEFVLMAEFVELQSNEGAVVEYVDTSVPKLSYS